jgi:hypothetical protein
MTDDSSPITREALTHLTPEQVNEARRAGHLDHLLKPEPKPFNGEGLVVGSKAWELWQRTQGGPE